MKTPIFIFLLVSCFALSADAQVSGEGNFKFLQNAYTNRTSSTLSYVIAEHQQYIAMFWESEDTDQALFMLASMYEEDSQYARAFLAYLKFKFMFPNSIKRKDAVSNLNQIVHNKAESTFEEKRKDIDDLISKSLSFPDLNSAYYEYLDFIFSLNISDVNELLLPEIRFYSQRYPKTVKNPDQLAYWSSEILQRLSDYDEAVVAYSKVIYITPQSPLIPQALLRSGRLQYEETSDYQKSKDSFVKLISSYPDTPEAAEGQFYLAQLYEDKLDQPDEAVTNYRILVENYPQSAFAVKALKRVAEIMDNKEKYNEAIATYHQIVELYPKDPYSPSALLEIESIYRRDLENYEKAIETLKFYAEQYPQQADAAEHLYDAAGMYADELNNKQAAIDTYNEVANKFPSSEYAKKALESIEELQQE